MYTNKSAIINVPFKKPQVFRKKVKEKLYKLTQS